MFLCVNHMYWAQWFHIKLAQEIAGREYYLLNAVLLVAKIMKSIRLRRSIMPLEGMIWSQRIHRVETHFH